MTEAICPACKTTPLASPWENEVRLCQRCATTYGVSPMHPPRRPARPCERCNSMQFIRAIPRELAVVEPPEGEPFHAASPMFVTYALERRVGVVGRQAPIPLDARHGFGGVELYICRGCGFVEWYCSDPEKIPLGPRYMTEAIDYGGDEPYR